MTHHICFAIAAGFFFAQPPAPPAATPSVAEPSAPANVKEPEPSKPLPEGTTIYHTLSGRDAQVIFTSDAPLEKVIGKSNAVVGFAVPGPKDNPAKLAQAKWVLPVRSLATGIPLRDQHLAGKDWLDADASPNIQFALSRVEDIKEVKRGEGFSTWSATIVGEMTVHSTAREVTVKDARLTFFQESAKTKSIAPGDLLFLKCDYTVKLSDFGVHNGDVPGKVSDSVTIAQMLRLSTVLPKESSPTPATALPSDKPGVPAATPPAPPASEPPPAAPK